MVIELHPFIDQAGSPEPAGYRRPEEIEFDDGSNFARYMPAAVGGKHLRGVVIPHAKPLGGSRAYDPHKPPHKRVHIDPHIEGQSVVVDLAQITQDIAQEAVALGEEYAEKHSDQVHGIDQLRLRSAAAFHLIGAAQRAQGSAPPASNGPAQVISVPQPGVSGPIPSAPPPVATGPRNIKAASFNGASAQHAPVAEPAAQRGGLLDAYQKPRTQPVEILASASVGPPTKKVTFGVPGFGLHEAYYHDVLVKSSTNPDVSEQLFILVYDGRFPGASKFLPQIDGAFAARIEGDPIDYRLCWPDQSFTDPTTGRTYFQLLIEERVPQGGPA
jgi:hypothetical protein